MILHHQSSLIHKQLIRRQLVCRIFICTERAYVTNKNVLSLPKKKASYGIISLYSIGVLDIVDTYHI